MPAMTNGLFFNFGMEKAADLHVPAGEICNLMAAPKKRDVLKSAAFRNEM